MHKFRNFVGLASILGASALLACPAMANDSLSQEELEKRLEEQQVLLERQSQLIEKQQMQLEELQRKIDTLSTKSSVGDTVTETTPTADSTEVNAETNTETNTETELAETEDPGPTPPGAEEAPTQASAQATGQQSDLNPNVTLVLLGGAQAGGAPDDEHKNTFFLQEAELGISAPVDPTTRAEAYISFPRDESPEVEEAYAQYSGLGNGLQLRGGIFRNEIGALNSTHSHALPQIDRPLNYTMFLGDEGMHSPGVELSYLLPVSWYSKATVSVSSRPNHHHHHEHGEEEGEEEEEEFNLFPHSEHNNPLWVARWENMADLNDDTTLNLGLTHATSKIDSDTLKRSSLSGVDLTLKWHPAEDTYKEFVWRSEYLKAHQSFQNLPDTDHRDLGGWYSYISYRMNKSFRLGLRYEEADSPIIQDGKMKRTSAILEFIGNEWNSLRLQYNHNNPSWQKSYDEALLQWNVVIGPHGAHKY